MNKLETMYPGKVYSPQTTLAVPINATATEITLTDASVLPEAPNIAVIGISEDAETILYKAKSGNILSGIIRAIARPDEARAWNAGAIVARNITSADLDTIQANVRQLHSEAESALEALETHLDEQQQVHNDHVTATVAHSSTTVPTENRISMWGAGGTMRVGEPVEGDHAVRLQEHNDHVIATVAHGSSTVPTENRISMWGAGGTMRVGEPVEDDHAVRLQDLNTSCRQARSAFQNFIMRGEFF